jgi:uncharacterized membrane protein (UPF0182 family)
LLQKILVAFGDQIAFEDTLDQALTELFGSSESEPSPSPTDPDAEPADPSVPSEPTTPSVNVQLALQQALEAIREKEAAMASGDWTAFGQAEQKLKRAIEAALDASR